MAVKKGYKLTDVGVIPEDWSAIELGSALTLQRGFDLPARSRTKGDVKIISSAGLGGTHNKSIVSGPGVVTGRYGTIGEVFFIEEDFWPLNTTLYVRNFRRNYPKYIFYLLKYVDLKSYSGKSGVPGINRNDVHQHLISLPPTKAEQTAIAKALSDTDSLIAALERLIAKKSAIKQGTMQLLLTGKTRLLGFSEEWEIALLGRVSEIKTGKKNNEDKVEDGIFPFFVRSQTVERINSFSFNGEAILVPGEGGIGTIIHYINGRFDYHQRVYKISDFSKQVCGKFIYYCMMQSFNAHATKNSVKATVDSLRLPTFQNFEIKMPNDVDEQEAIAQVLTDMDNEIAGLLEKLDKYKAVKSGMMQQLLTGKIRLV
jgi:type I restriction enzyme S subunit